MIWAFKYTIFRQNFFKAQNRQLERVKKEVRFEDGTVTYELGSQYTNFFYDMNAEAWGWNREAGESRWSHFKRICNANFDHD
jgi:hypothetical protein